MITSKYLAGDGLPKSKAALIIFVAGLVNGIGMLAYTKMISSPSVELSKFVPIAAALVPVFAMLIAVVLFGDPITLKKIAGLTLACVAVFLLS
jgi:drug/metabolite transporter (DMT)-like permease